MLLFCAGTAAANPQGGQVVGGQATITNTAPNTLTIDQTTPRAAIDWKSFNIGPNQTTQFVQPSASAIALNRVQAGDPSVIAGRLTANGQLVLINPSGIVFTKGAQVDVNSLLATPTGISTANFMAGRMIFDQPSSDPNARVINNGHITVAQAGLAALVAPGVANNGVISAKLGRVVLGGAQTYTLDFYGDGLIQFD
ncbi:MAG TPA: filamentous hemagglutinin N-terminal domain-containing protein, partial [Stellaceae bacterium]|nr:filamentous hemagglutinin N-terminal domain-containing protein [Stellaceae bacterium]